MGGMHQLDAFVVNKSRGVKFRPGGRAAARCCRRTVSVRELRFVFTAELHMSVAERARDFKTAADTAGGAAVSSPRRPALVTSRPSCTAPVS